jgi:hypothetical protein
MFTSKQHVITPLFDLIIMCIAISRALKISQSAAIGSMDTIRPAAETKLG